MKPIHRQFSKEEENNKFFSSLYRQTKLLFKSDISALAQDVAKHGRRLLGSSYSPISPSSDSHSTLSSLGPHNLFGCEQYIQSGLSTFGKSIEGTLCFLSCDLSGHGIQRLTGLQHYRRLEHLDCSQNQLETVRELETLQNLFFLNISSNRLNKITVPRLSRRLVHLDLSHNQLKALPQISQLAFLRILDLSYNSIVEVRDLQHPHLEELHLSNNEINTLEGRLSLPNLEILDLSFNSMVDISDLSSTELSTSRKMELLEITNQTKSHFQNSLTSPATPLPPNSDIGIPLPKLKILRLNRNKIRSLLPLARIPSLIELEIASNEITCLDQIDALSSVGLLSSLDLSMNPCQSIKFYRFHVIFLLAQLSVLDGQTVDPKEATKAAAFFDQSVGLDKQHFKSVLPNENFIDKRVFMQTLVMKTHVSPKIDLNLPNLFGKENIVKKFEFQETRLGKEHTGFPASKQMEKTNAGTSTTNDKTFKFER